MITWIKTKLRCFLLGSWAQLHPRAHRGFDATYREAYRVRRCIVPVDGFFEWKVIKRQKANQLYANSAKDGKPFGIRGIWENWKDPATGKWVRTFSAEPHVCSTDMKPMEVPRV